MDTVRKINQMISSVTLLRDDEEDEYDPVIVMLEAIAENGSINQAAKAVGISYKAAWERIDTLNNLSTVPLVERKTGGSGGGGTLLTAEGERFLAQAKLFQQDLGKLLGIFRATEKDAFKMLQTLRGMEMRISARNVWLGNVRTIEKGPVSAIVEIALKGRDTIISSITTSSVERLGLEKGKEVLAIVKAPDVLISHEIDPDTISASNILTGPVSRIIAGKVNDEITIDIDGGNTVTAIVTSSSVKRLDLHEGLEVCAIIKASNVLVAVP